MSGHAFDTFHAADLEAGIAVMAKTGGLLRPVACGRWQPARRVLRPVQDPVCCTKATGCQGGQVVAHSLSSAYTHGTTLQARTGASA